MPRKRDPNKPRPNVWKDALYGTYEGPRGSAAQWRAAFQDAVNMTPDEVTRRVGDSSPWAVLSEMSGIKLAADATMDQIKKAYRACAQKFHPDKWTEEKKAWATEQFKNAHACYAKLGGKA